MNAFRRLAALVLKDLKAEWRSGSSLGALLVYSLSTVFLVYRAFMQVPQSRVWSTLLWLILMFSSAFLSAGLFRHESGAGRTYYYALVNPGELFISKYVTALLLQLLALVFILTGFSVLLGFRAESGILFILAFWLSGLAVAGQFVFAAAVASKAEAGGGLTAVLGLPLLLPTLLVSLQTAGLAVDGLTEGIFWRHLLTLAGLCVLPLILGAGLFSYLWHD
jgi:ABC-type transport system involved in cytochrome c biogenesis permease component